MTTEATDYKIEFKRLVKLVQSLCPDLRQEQIANELGYNSSYLSEMMGKRGKVNQGHIDHIQQVYRNVLRNAMPKPQKEKGSNFEALRSEILQEIRDTITTSFREESPITSHPKFEDLLELISEAVAGKNLRSKQEARAVILSSLNAHKKSRKGVLLG